MKRLLPIGAALLALVLGAAGHAGLGSSAQEDEAKGNAAPPAVLQQKAVPLPVANQHKNALEIAKADARDDAGTALGENICRFLGVYVGPAQDSVQPSEIGSPYCPGIAVDAKHERYAVMLAVLPDPVHTHLALRFDRSVDAIQNSLQDLGWIFDSAWMPWEQREHEETGSFEQRVTSEEAKNEFEYGPGVMLFHSESENTRPLVVLTVGDTPTAGVNARQFRRAMEVYKRLTGWDEYFIKGTPGKEDKLWDLAILGPTYTGSAPSMRRLMEEVSASAAGTETGAADLFSCPRRPLRIAVSTGTMSNSGSVDWLATDTTWCPRLVLESRSFAIDLSYEYTEVLDYLHRHHDLNPNVSGVRVGVLSEEESVFGTTLQKAQLPLEHKRQEERLERERQKKRLTDPAAQDRYTQLAQEHFHKLADDLNWSKDEIYRQNQADALFIAARPRYFYFPREISTLRSAYEQSGIFGFGASSDTDKTQLHLSYGSDTRADDSVHTFAGKQGGVAMEAQMAQLSAALEQERITVVLLSATDALDEIFVTRYLAEHAPNVAVIVLDADDLFLRSGSTGMQNAYVISPWPLLPRNPEWTSANGEEAYPGVPPARLFPSGSTQGLYNAMRVLLCDPALWGVANGSPGGVAPECGAKPDAVVGLREYRPPVGLEQIKTADLMTEPPLWLMSVSRGGFWPMALIDVDQMADCLPESAWFNLPPMDTKVQISSGNCKLGFGYDPTQKNPLKLPVVHALGVHELAPRSAKVLVVLVGLLLVWHGAACLYCRLDRDFAWSYALADKDHMGWRLSLQIGLGWMALPVLDLLDPLSLPDMSIRTREFVLTDFAVQGLALLVMAIPFYLWLGKGAWTLADAHERKHRWMKMAVAVPVGLLLLVLLRKLVWLLVLPPASVVTERAFFLYRSGYIFSGSSPVLPLLLLLAGLALAMVNRFQRLVFYRGRIPELPPMTERDRYPGQLSTTNLRRLLSHTSDPVRLWLIAALALLLLVLALAFRQALPRSLGHGRFDLWIIVLSGLLLLLLLHDLATAVLAWTMLRGEVLVPLAHSPIRWGFTWIDGFSWEKIWAPGAMSRHHLFRYIMRLQEANQRSLYSPALAAAFTCLKDTYAKEPWRAEWSNEVSHQLGVVHHQLAVSAEAKLVELTALYKKDAGPITGESTKERGLPQELPLSDFKGVERPEALKRVAMEEFVALLYLGFIRMVLLQIRNRLMTAACLYVLLLWALTSYPFLNHHALLIALSCLLLVLAAIVIGVYAQMHRDEILSRTTETTSGELGSDFFTKVLGMVGLPLTTLIASQFPELSNAIFSWLEPGLSTIK